MLGVSRDGRGGCYAIGLTTGVSRFVSRQVQEFPPPHAIQTDSGAQTIPIQWLNGGLFHRR